MGIEACRELESARCRLAEACGDVPDAESCERFYRDQCLHGLSVPEPSDREVEACAAALDEAAECARAGDDSAACRDACDAVSSPASLRACVFLATDDLPDDPGEGGQGGSTSASDPNSPGSGGTAGDHGGSDADQSAGTAGSDTN